MHVANFVITARKLGYVVILHYGALIGIMHSRLSNNGLWTM